MEVDMNVVEMSAQADADLQVRAQQMGVPPEVLLIVETLQADAQEKEGAALSLARLSKRTQLRMSTLRRFLSALEEAGVVKVEMNEDGTGSVTLLVSPQ
ncbi:transcriptional regulator [Herbaspirillum rubrisubalbicans]|uniref:Transcriptional regulator n=2 Tax=Herbaspirillum rubrisubalbicans TaxID=80842 RepID=A0ABX9BWU9_9BURK|nr:transcriptional regulator [Herbaspirillum rubrisubalbicans]RAN50186.1 transcriptional regulator [Herbaspirillum rubrisubalbicans]